jgi:hypothetical protein
MEERSQEEKSREEIVREDLELIFERIFDSSYEEPTYPRGGNERFYKTPKALATVAIDYFLPRLMNHEPISIKGFILRSKFANPQALYNYRSYSEDYHFVVQRISDIIEEFNINSLYSINYPGSRFVLQCNSGWVPTEKIVNENHDIKISIGHKKEDSTINQNNNQNNEQSSEDIQRDNE